MDFLPLRFKGHPFYGMFPEDFNFSLMQDGYLIDLNVKNNGIFGWLGLTSGLASGLPLATFSPPFNYLSPPPHHLHQP
ncbi:MAG: hypothetical protein QW212_02105 [Nitrososphaerales archaeon]